MNKSKKMLKKTSEKTYNKNKKTLTEPLAYKKEKSTSLQKKLINHITKNGEKHKSEKTITKSFKAAQKSQKKNHGKITKLSIINTIPTFKIIKLTDKKRKKKSIKEIPKLLSNYTSRVSLGLKYLVKTTATTQTKQTAFFEKFKNELLLGTSSENTAITIKNNYQTKALQEKKYFRFYRW